MSDYQTNIAGQYELWEAMTTELSEAINASQEVVEGGHISGYSTTYPTVLIETYQKAQNFWQKAKPKAIEDGGRYQREHGRLELVINRTLLDLAKQNDTLNADIAIANLSSPFPLRTFIKLATAMLHICETGKNLYALYGQPPDSKSGPKGPTI